MQIILKFLVIILLVIFQFSEAFSSEDYYKGLTLSASAGPSYVSGHYNDYLENGYTTGLGAIYNLPFLKGNTYFTGGVSYYSFSMESSHESLLQQGDFYGGCMFSIPLVSYIFVNMGISLHGIYSVLDTDNTERHETTFKYGRAGNFGTMIYLGKGVGLFASTEFRITELTSRHLYTASLSAGFTYNFNDYRADIESRENADKKIALFDQGINEFRKKNFHDAKKLFSDLYKLDSGYPGLDYYIRRIEDIEQNYLTAENLISQKNFLKAIPYLDKCSPYIKECELKLLQQRKNLRPNIAGWEKEGIRLYDNREYRECINVMEKILLVDPENKNANIYLPRAVKRNKAIESLQSE